MVVEAAPELNRSAPLIQKGLQARGDYTRQDIDQLAREISSLTGQDPTTVRQWLVRKAFATGDLKTLNVIRQLIQKDGQIPTQEAAPKEASTAQLKPAQDLDLLLHQIFNIRSDLQKQKATLEQQFTGTNKAEQALLKENYTQFLSQTVSSPRAFASLLVNNRPLFILLKTNPVGFSSALALLNPNMQMSPALLSVFAAFVGNVMKLKQTKPATTEEDEKAKLDRDQEVLLEETDNSNSTVKNLRETINQMPVSPLRDFLLEAERFAEEEIANLWSITLKKEKQLERLVKEMPDEMKQMIKAFPHLEKKHLIEKFKSIQRKKPGAEGLRRITKAKK